MNNSEEQQGWRFYLQEKVVTIFLLGFSAGLPFPLVYSTLTGWLEEADIERSTISTFCQDTAKKIRDSPSYKEGI